MNFNTLHGIKHLGKSGFLLALWCFFISGCGVRKDKADSEPSRPAKLFIVGAEDNSAYHFYPAKIRSGQRVKLAFQVPGQIVKFPVKSGQPVAKGELLGELDSRDYENTYKSAVARYQESKTDFARYSKLVNKHAVAIAVFEEKRKSFEVAEAEMKIAGKALADTRLIAPFDGVVAATYIDNFQNIQAKQEILSLQGNTDIELIVNVPEKDVIQTPASSLPLPKLNEMLQAVAIFPALKNLAFPVKIKEFETEADSVTQTFRGVLTMPSPKEFSIMPGMTALVRILDLREHQGHVVFRIPAVAVGEDADGKSHVWLVDSKMTAHKRAVVVGAMFDDKIIVNSGLKHGEVIVAAGTGFVTEGMKIKELSHIGSREIGKLNGSR